MCVCCCQARATTAWPPLPSPSLSRRACGPPTPSRQTSCERCGGAGVHFTVRVREALVPETSPVERHSQSIPHLFPSTRSPGTTRRSWTPSQCAAMTLTVPSCSRPVLPSKSGQHGGSWRPGLQPSPTHPCTAASPFIPPSSTLSWEPMSPLCAPPRVHTRSTPRTHAHLSCRRLAGPEPLQAVYTVSLLSVTHTPHPHTLAPTWRRLLCECCKHMPPSSPPPCLFASLQITLLNVIPNQYIDIDTMRVGGPSTMRTRHLFASSARTSPWHPWGLGAPGGSGGQRRNG